ncbi:protein-L-isoaspartate O-methyltransferase [Tardiphaga sp.]|uniref:protein-L-isoaspartate O-methyltransferase family protein n=1 Tax=Tardiphaga sp. TaxID=1926292 RepID=UPI00352AE896
MSDFSTARQKMVDGQVRPSDVTDLRIIDAMLAVPREEFVPASQRAMAYLDLDLEVAPNRFLIKPVVLARMLQASDVKATDKVLVVGCPTGYSAAVIAQFAGKVTATEGDAALAAKASEDMARLGYSNITLAAGMPADGHPANAPYDLIVLAGATEVLPTGLYKQLAPGGQLVGVFALTKPARAMIVTHSHDDFGSRPLFDATAPVLPGLEKLPEFVF